MTIFSNFIKGKLKICIGRDNFANYDKLDRLAIPFDSFIRREPKIKPTNIPNAIYANLLFAE